MDRALAKILSARKKKEQKEQKGQKNDIEAALDRIKRKRTTPPKTKTTGAQGPTPIVDRDDVMAALRKIRAKRSQASTTSSNDPAVVATTTSDATINSNTNTTTDIPASNSATKKNMASVFAMANAHTTASTNSNIIATNNNANMASNTVNNGSLSDASAPTPNVPNKKKKTIDVPTIDLTDTNSAVTAKKTVTTKATSVSKPPHGFVGKQFQIPDWATEERAHGLALEVEKDGRIIDSIPMGEKSHYTLGRSTIPGGVDTMLLHRSLSRLHAAIVHGTPKGEKGATLFDLSSANGTFLAIGGQWVRLVPRQPYVLQEGDRIAFGNSTRAYIVTGLRCPTPPPDGVGPMEQARQAQEKLEEAAKEEEKDDHRKQTIIKKRAAKKKNWQNNLQTTFSGFSEKDKFLKLLMGKKQKT